MLRVTQQLPPTPSPTSKLTYLNKKTHKREKRKNKKAWRRKTLLTQLKKEEDTRGVFLIF